MYLVDTKKSFVYSQSFWMNMDWEGLAYENKLNIALHKVNVVRVKHIWVNGRKRLVKCIFNSCFQAEVPANSGFSAWA